MRQFMNRLAALTIGLAISVGMMTATASSASAHTTAWKQTGYYNMWCYTYHTQTGSWFWATHKGYAVCDTRDYGGPAVSYPTIGIWKVQVKCKSGAVSTSSYVHNVNYPNQQVAMAAPQSCDSDGIYSITVLDVPYEYYLYGTGIMFRTTFYH